MTQRDSIVMVPQLGPQKVAAARAVAKKDRAFRSATKQGGALRKMAKAKAMQTQRRRAAQRRLAARKVKRPGGAGRTAARGSMRLAGKGATRAIANPVGAAAGALLLVGLVALRLASGRSFENMGAQMNKMFLGDMDDKARAKMATREHIHGNREAMRIVAQQHGTNNQISRVMNELTDMNLRDEKGRSVFQEDKRFQNDNVFDMLILRATKKFQEIWSGTGGPGRVEELRLEYGSYANNAGSRR